MKILGIENVSFVDYPNKICATVFTGGCNFKCPYCHNSGIVKNEYPLLDENEILENLEKRKKLIDAVTVSGGEPTLQKDLVEFIQKVKNMGFLIKLDTNGTNPKVLKELLDKNLLNYVAMDIKTNFDNYSVITKSCVKIENIKESLNLLRKSNISYELRTTLISGYHTTEAILALSQDLKGEKTLYLQKFKDSETCFESGLKEVEKLTALEFKNILLNTIQNVELRGY